MQLGESTSRFRTLSSTPIVPITYYNGASVMYNTIAEIISSDDTPIYKKIYKYTLPDLGGYKIFTQNDIWDFHVHNYANWFTDHLDRIDTYEYTNNSYRKVSTDNYLYDLSSHPSTNYTIQGREYRNDFHENFHDSDLNLIKHRVYGEHLDYNVTPRAKVLVSQTHTDFMSNGIEMTTSKVYKYENQSDIRITSQIISQGEEQYAIHTSYPSNINNGVYAEMVKKNMLDYPIEEQVEHNEKIVSARLMTYLRIDNSFYPSKIYTYTPGIATFSYQQFQAFNGTNINKAYTPLLSLTYSNGRIESFTDRQGITTSYTWDHFLQDPIMERKVGAYTEHRRTFTYIPGIGMTSETSPNKNTTTYVYDSAGRLSEIRDYNDKKIKKYSYKIVSGSTINGTIKPSNK